MSVQPGQRRLSVVPLSFADACAMVEQLHRHHRPPRGHKFSLGVLDDAGHLHGVAIVGRPVAAPFDNGWCVEATRVATDGTPNACSALYGAAWRTAKAAGYLRAITYTQDGESGVSLRAAGWRLVAELRPRKGWDTPSRPRADRGTDGIARRLWEQSRTDAPHLPSLATLRNEIRNEKRCPAPACGKPIHQAARGRPARYCSPACRLRAHRQRTTSKGSAAA
ncbi:XF1762 family protein [Streptomyces sp. NPDC093085]|uniref:XF1762 family protein n=1 Tax=Streptomyces sp. NPDC093085 TaxID=3155068 RepID=UPI003440F476